MDPSDQYFNYIRGKYHLSRERWHAIYKSQGYGCAICHKKKILVVDHDHRCCKVGSCGLCIRGLLCVRCNNGIGLMLDNPQILNTAASYIQDFRKSIFIDNRNRSLTDEINYHDFHMAIWNGYDNVRDKLS
jgi:hypothetical protein